jgi:hypothetical protein
MLCKGKFSSGFVSWNLCSYILFSVTQMGKVLEKSLSLDQPLEEVHDLKELP